MKTRAILLVLGLGLAAARAPDMRIDWFAIDCGGGHSAGGAYGLHGTIGQPDAGVLGDSRFLLVGGFWGGAASLARLLEPTPTPGYVLREYYGANSELPRMQNDQPEPDLGLTGSTISDLKSHPSYPGAPKLICFTTLFELNSFDQGNNYGARIRGLFRPRATGLHRFYLCANEQAELYLSGDTHPETKFLIARELVGHPRRDWTGTVGRPNRENISSPIALEAGKSYYIEALMKESDGADHLAVAVQEPGAPVPANGSSPIPGDRLATVAPNPGATLTITQQPEDLVAQEFTTATFTVAAEAASLVCGGDQMSVQWQKNGEDIPGATAWTYTTPPLTTDDDASIFRARVWVPGVTVLSDPATLFVPTLPMTLQMGTFILRVLHYDDFTYDPVTGRLTDATGDAYTAMSCEDTVVSPNIKVRFQNLTIVNSGVPGVGLVTAGSASYPTTPPEPASLATTVDGFTLFFDRLDLLPAQATAPMRLRFPPTLIATAGCGPPELTLGVLPIRATAACDFHVAFPAQAFGPWLVGETGIAVQGTGITVDFSTTWSPATEHALAPAWRGVVLSTGTTVAAPSGEMVSNTGYLRGPYSFSQALVTGTGFQDRLNLSSAYEFRTAQPLGYQVFLTEGELDVADSAVASGQFRNGTIRLPTTAVRGFPDPAVTGQYTIMTVQANLDLFAENVVVARGVDQGLWWGDLTGATPLRAFAVSPPGVGQTIDGYIYFAAALRPAYFPLDPADDFAQPEFPGSPSAMAGYLDWANMQGFTTKFIYGGNAAIYTPDKADPSAPIRGQLGQATSWLNVGAQGVHGCLRLLQMVDNPQVLGPTSAPYYQADASGLRAPFLTTLVGIGAGGSWLPPIDLQFVHSAVYHSSGNGSVRLEGPTKADLPIREAHFTSTAHLPGAEVQIDVPIPLDYWQVQLEERPTASKAGVVSFKTGEVFLTGAGIREARHFAEPFWLMWGVIYASGDWGQTLLDLNYAGQQFDGFTYAPEIFLLSPYDPADSEERRNAYIQVAGLINFDFFGAKYLNIIDRYSDIAEPPYDNRSIELVTEIVDADTTTAGAASFNPTIELSGLPPPEPDLRPSDLHLARDWGAYGPSRAKFGDMDFDIRYNELVQDGFLGNGTTWLHFIGLMDQSSIILRRQRICVCFVSSQSETETRSLVLPGMMPVGADFCTVWGVSGCGCIKDGALERIVLNAELSKNVTAGHSVLRVKEGGYGSFEAIITPASTSFEIRGLLFLNAGAGAANLDLEVNGSARLITNFEEDYTDAEIEGDLRAALAAGLTGETLEASGRLNWHRGADAVWLQGKLGIGLKGLLSLGAEGGFFAGYNAPQNKVWVLTDQDPRYRLDLEALFPGGAPFTGFYGYVKCSAGFDIFILSGGCEVLVGAGMLPGLVAHAGVHVWGEILGGLVSVGAWGHLALVLPPAPPGFQGTVGLEGCVLWVICASIDVTVTVSASGGISLD